MTELQAVLSNPNWFPIGFDLKADTLTFLKTNREAVSEAAFLDQRFYPPNPVTQTVELSAAISTPFQSSQISWIFHTAFCCSTLLARALDLPGKSVALKEPDILMQLANARRMAAQNGLTPQKLEAIENLVLNLLGRPFAPSEAVLIKPTNSTNPLIDLALGRAETCLFMVSPLEDFLVSVIKKGEACRSFVRTLFNIFSLDPAGLSQIPQRQAMTFTDLQIAALVWHHQVQFMAQAAGRPNARIKAMDGTKLPETPSPYLSAAVDFFALGWAGAEITAQTDGTVFSKNSKFGDQSYDANLRDAEALTIRTTHSSSIEATLEWAAAMKLRGRNDMLPAPSLV